MKKFFYNLLGILLFGAIFTGIAAFSEHVRIEREKETTAVSTRYQIVNRIGYITKDMRIANSGSEPASPYRLSYGKNTDIVIDFSGEPEIEAFYQSKAEQFFRVEGIMRTETSTTASGATNEWHVIEVLKLKVLKTR